MTYTETPIHLRPLTELGPEIGGRGKDGGRRTTGRRKEKDPDFPPVYRINGRGYVEAGAWENYKRLLMARGMEKTAERLTRGCGRA